MAQKISGKSSILFLILNGKLESVLTPWHITVDFEEQSITIKKRNWYLIGVDQEVTAFRFIRKISIDEHVFGADIHIGATGSSGSAYYLSKKKAREFKNALIAYNQEKKANFVFA